MKRFVPERDEDWPEAVSAGLVLVPYQPGVCCYHALRDGCDAPQPRAESAAARAEARAGD